MKEKVEVQRQAEKENTDLLKQVKLLEAELEEQVNRTLELERAQTEEGSDLRQQVQALEKQLEKTRKFLDVSGCWPWGVGSPSPHCLLPPPPPPSTRLTV